MTTPTPSSAPSGRSRLPAPRVALDLFGESVAHRAELAALELEEAREHLTGSAILAGAVAALALFTGFAFTLLVASLVWDLPSRAWWLGGLCVLYLGAAATCGVMLSHRLRTWKPLGELQNQMQQDCQCLSQLIKSIVP
jgi:uncharacterized membrane protein YqjE